MSVEHPAKLLVKLEVRFSSFLLLSKRLRPEVLNNLTLTLLKMPQKDMEQVIFRWTAGLRDSQALQSEQHFEEAIRLQELMEVAWPGERRVAERRNCIVHW